MYIIIENNTNVVLMKGDIVKYLPNGYPVLVNENVAFPNYMVQILEVESVPTDFDSRKYCYTLEKGFYANPNWIEPNPYGIPNDIYNSIIDDYTDELIEMGVL